MSKVKRGLGVDVLTAARARVRRTLHDFPNVYVSFSGGKDSGVVLELAASEARAQGRRIGCLVIDLEAQYTATVDYVHTMLDRHADVLDVYWVALPLTLRNAVSLFQPTWRCWDPAESDRWVRPLPQHPGAITDPGFFDFFVPGMEFEDFTVAFGHWYAQRNGGRLTAAMVGIRADESLNRFRTIASRTKKTHEGLQWTTWLGDRLYNAYPIYDWRTLDDWIFYGSQKVPYNLIYDLMHRAGLSIHQARLCQPYGQDQKKGLWLYQILEPHTWARVVARVQGANFGARYARASGNINGRIRVEKPENLTWQQYAMLLLNTMPEISAEMFRTRIAWFVHWHMEKGFPDGIPDDGPLNRKDPSWYRVVKVILENDVYCTALTFGTPTSIEAWKKYQQTMKIKRDQWGIPGL